MSQIQVTVTQSGLSSARGEVRNHQVMIDRPEAKGGTDEGPMGGELLLLAYGGCFMSNLLAAIAAREAEVHEVSITVSATLASGPPRFSAIDMRVHAQYTDQALMEKLITISERGCIVHNTLKDGTTLTVGLAESVVGQ